MRVKRAASGPAMRRSEEDHLAYDELIAARVRDVLKGRHGVAETKMMGGLCFMIGGSMCCSVSGRGGLLVRIARNTYEQMLSEPHAQSVAMRGRTMTGFIRVEPEGYRTAAALKTWIERGIVAANAAKASGEKPRRKTGKIERKKQRN